jgi:hypothetical protein
LRIAIMPIGPSSARTPGGQMRIVQEGFKKQDLLDIAA